MERKAYRLREGSLQEKFQDSRAKIQMFAGGYANGKTTSAVIKGIKLARDYPGSNGLVARSTYPKLTNTIRKEFRHWIPKGWVARDVDSKVNVMELKNGSVINFSHVQQTGKTTESSTSNLLSATYDWIIIDQIEDPEITEKDFMDLLGRLRGSTPYSPSNGVFDETMPSSGPRWFIIMCNPTRNWVYRKLVKPLQDYARGIKNNELIADENGKPLMELFEGSTYENAENLEDDYIATQEAAYKGQMRERFLLGKWGAYEGLVYPDYDPEVHQLPHDLARELYEQLYYEGAQDNIVEAYDHGIAKQACYLFGFVSPGGDVIVLDGFYEKEQTVAMSAARIKAIRGKHGYGQEPGQKSDELLKVLADPAIFKRATGNASVVGVTTAGLFKERGVKMVPGNNEIINGLAKVQSYLSVDMYHRNPLHDNVIGAPRFYFSDNLQFIDHEFVDYMWKKDTAGEYEDTPTDKNDHAMDAIKYLLSHRPKVVIFKRPTQPGLPPRRQKWHEDVNDPFSNTRNREHRYGRR